MTGARERVVAVCSGLPGAEQTFPFGEGVAVFKVRGKIFALVSLGPAPGSLSVKVEPDLGAGLVREHASITPGYHLDKRHWVTVELDGSVPAKFVAGLVEDSYDLVVAALPRRLRDELSQPGAPGVKRTGRARGGRGSPRS